MRYIKLPGTTKDASVIALGTAWYGTDIPEDTAFRMMDLFQEKGGNLLDTAHMYASWVDGGAGKSETTIGKWLRRNTQNRPLIMTKGADLGMDRATIRRQLQESLDRLGLESVDFYWLHRDDPSVPVADIIGWLDELVAEGRFLAYGASNWRVGRLDAARLHAASVGSPGFAASQISWSLARAKPELVQTGGQVFMDDEMMAYHRQHQFPCIGYSAQAGGFFGGKYDPLNPTPGTTPNPAIVRLYATPHNHALLARCQAIAAELGSTPNRVALAYLSSESFPGIGIAGAGNPAQTEDACAAGDLHLDPATVARLLGDAG